jgi:pimeloyl-ACP methyl ester carboxylesterase
MIVQRRAFMAAMMTTAITTAVQTPTMHEKAMKYPTYYRTIAIDGLSIFYREAGAKDAPTILLLHGLPSSSRMFEPLFKRLADRYHLLAPDYPGFGHSDWPNAKGFAYTFDRYAEIMARFTEAVGISHYTLYMQDYGGPVGFRMALAHPERVEGLSFRTLWRTTKGWERIGRQGEPFGRTVVLMRMLSASTYSSLPPRGRATSVMIPVWSAMIQTFGRTSLRSSVSQARLMFKVTSSTTTARTLRRTRNGKPGCAKDSRASS